MKRKGAGYHHGDLRRTLVEATTKLVDSRGTEGFTLRAAAKLAGVSDGAPYHHFEHKDALLATVAEESFQLLQEEMLLAADLHRGNPRRQSRAMGAAYIAFALKHPARFRLMFGPSRRARSRRDERVARGLDLVRDTLCRTISVPESNPPSRDAALAVWALVHGLSVLAIDGHFGSSGGTTKRVERLAWVSMEQLLAATTARDFDVDETPASSARPRAGKRRAVIWPDAPKGRRSS